MPLALSISGARGIIGEDITPQIIQNIVCAFHKFIPDGPILLGRDTRQSGKAISQIIIGVLKLLGRDVIDAGINPTPTICLCTKELGCAGGIAITASHNPAQWNGIKLIGPDGLFLPASFWQDFSDNKYDEPVWASFNRIGNETVNVDCPKIHIDKVLHHPSINVDAIRNFSTRVAYDGVGGAGPAIIIPMLERIGIHFDAIGNNMNGEFIHPPEPIPENLGMLAQLVKETSAQIGFATDPDADRLALVDENANSVGEEFTLLLSIYYILSKNKGDIVVNLSTTTLVEYLAENFGVNVFRTKVGEYWVSKKIAETGAIIGGEGNGGVIIPTIHPVRDAAIAMVSILSLLAETGKQLSKIVSEFPKKVMIKDKIERCPEFSQIAESIVNEFDYIEINTIDGVWLRTQDGFIHIRPSNTEPIIRIIVEGEHTVEVKKIIRKAKSIIKNT